MLWGKYVVFFIETMLWCGYIHGQRPNPLLCLQMIKATYCVSDYCDYTPQHQVEQYSMIINIITCFETSRSRSVQGRSGWYNQETTWVSAERILPSPPGEVVPQRWELRRKSADPRWLLDAWTWSGGKPGLTMYNIHTHSPVSHAIFNKCHVEQYMVTKLCKFQCLGTKLKASP